MNYFSHFLTIPSQQSKYLTLGSILPDLLRDSKLDSFLFLQKEYLNYNLSEQEQQLSNGIRYHLLVDKYFHNSNFFKNYTKAISSAIRKNNSISVDKYTYFIAHIILELYIDYILIKKYSSKLNLFYTQLEKIEDVLIINYFKKLLPNHDYELFLIKKDKFVEARFLEKYKTTKELGTIVSMVLEKVAIQPLTYKDQLGITDLIHNEFGMNIEADIPVLFNEILQYEKTIDRNPTFN